MEATNGQISRRSTRLFLGEQEAMEAGIIGQVERESMQFSEEKEQERSQKPPMSWPPENSIKVPTIPLVDFGTDLSGIFPSTLEAMSDHGMPYKVTMAESSADAHSSYQQSPSFQSRQVERRRQTNQLRHCPTWCCISKQLPNG